jgi:iron complex outermembrane receptor protein
MYGAKLMKIKRYQAAFIICVTFSFSFIPPSIAADEPELALEEVIVTAQKREQFLQSTPVTIDVLSGDWVDAAQIESIAAIAAFSPGVSIDAFPASQPRVFIRGVGSGDTGAGGDQSSAVYVDGIHMSRPGFLAFDSFDVNRIEVLKGPQGTLWGKNVVGGLIHVINNQPDETMSGRLQATVGNEGIVNLAGMLNAPLGEWLSSRFVLISRQHDGFAYNQFTGNELFDEDRLAYRAMFLARPTDALELGLSIYGADEDNAGSARNQFDGSVAGLSRDPDGDSRTTTGEIDGFERRDTQSTTFTVDWRTQVGDFHLIANHRELDLDFLEDLDGNNLLQYLTEGAGNPLQIQRGVSEDSQVTSLELRLSAPDESKLFWQVGTYLEDVETDQRTEGGLVGGGCYYDLAALGAPGVPAAAAVLAALTGASIPDIAPTAIALCGLTDASVSATLPPEVAVATNETTTMAVFGELTYAFTERTNLTAGLRWTKDEKDYTADTSETILPITIDAPYSLVAASDSWSEPTWRLTLDSQFNDNLFGYATVSTGYKAGGFQDVPPNPTDARTSFDPEKVINYEAGIKSEIWDQRARLNATVFYMDYTDLQVRQLDGTISVTTNAGKAKIQGLELEFQAVPVDGLQLAASYTYLDTEFTEFVQEGEDYSGNQLSRTPKNAYRLNAAYSLPIANGDLSIEADYAWNDDRFDDNSNQPPEIIDSYGLLDARIRYVLDGWEVSLWGRNLTDEEYITHYPTFSGFAFVTFGPPRTYGLTVSKTFQ